MNVTDKWMVEQMAQMAAVAASSVPQLGANTDQPAKIEQSESFRDVLDKTKAQQTEDQGIKIEKSENPENQEAIRQAEENKFPTARPLLTRDEKVTVSTEDAAMLAAGYAQLYQPSGEGPKMIVTAQDQNGTPVIPTPQNPETPGIIPGITTLYASVEDSWTIEPTPEITTAIEQLLQRAGDSRSSEDVIGEMLQKTDNARAAAPSVDLVVDDEAAERYATYGDPDLWKDQYMTAQAMNERTGLFRTVEDGLVKVGDTYLVDTQETSMDAQLAQIIDIAVQDGLKQIEIKLDPENLGSLTIKLTQNADGTLQVVIQASNSKAADLLNKHLDGLSQALQGYDLGREVRVEVQRNENGQQAQQQADPDGHNQQQQRQNEERQQESGEAFIQRMRLGLTEAEDELLG